MAFPYKVTPFDPSLSHTPSPYLDKHTLNSKSNMTLPPIKWKDRMPECLNPQMTSEMLGTLQRKLTPKSDVSYKVEYPKIHERSTFSKQRGILKNNSVTEYLKGLTTNSSLTPKKKVSFIDDVLHQPLAEIQGEDNSDARGIKKKVCACIVF